MIYPGTTIVAYPSRLSMSRTGHISIKLSVSSMDVVRLVKILNGMNSKTVTKAQTMHNLKRKNVPIIVIQWDASIRLKSLMAWDIDFVNQSNVSETNGS